jgi:6-phosphogluconate dehydrogenase
MNTKTQWGIAGMGVMGTSLSRNFSQKEISLALFNRRVEGEEEGVALKKKQLYSELNRTQAFEELKDFVSAIERPRKIFIMLPAGVATSHFLEQLIPLLSKGDIVIDGGNAHYKETEKRAKRLKDEGVLFLGVGVSGGEEGALKGPSLMVGGDHTAYEIVKEDLFKIAAKNSNKIPCCAYFGTGGAGHFVKMVHNGIEYAEMQLLAELYALASCTMSHDEIQKTLSQWSATKSKSYLLEITASLLKFREDKTPFIELIQDQASNKGTGAWATASGTELGYPNSLMAAALHARFLSFFKKERTQFSEHFDKPRSTVNISSSLLKNAYDLSRWINHHQGFKMLTLAAKEYKWSLNLSQVASVWSEGCIIKSDLMDDCIKLLQDNTMLLLSKDFKQVFTNGKENWKELLQQAVANEIPTPCMQSAWTYFAALKTQNSSANIIQAQRDYFGAHGILRTDNDSQDLEHGPWSS